MDIWRAVYDKLDKAGWLLIGDDGRRRAELGPVDPDSTHQYPYRPVLAVEDSGVVYVDQGPVLRYWRDPQTRADGADPDETCDLATDPTMKAVTAWS